MKLKVEAVRAWGALIDGSYLGHTAKACRPTELSGGPFTVKAVRCRIIRDTDYKRLLKAAKGSK